VNRYPDIISKLFYEPVAITRAHHRFLCSVVEAHMAKVDGPRAEAEADEEAEAEYTQIGKTVIIPVRGVLTGHADDIPMSTCGCGMDALSEKIDVALNDSSVSTLLFNYRTPGGSVVGLPELGDKIAGIVSKRTIGFTDSQCCSGGMWLAMQCQQFYCTGSARVGSIGVWCAYMDATKALKKEGIKIQEFFAGKYKTMGAYWKSLSEEESAMLQASVDKIHAQFKEAVETRREVADEFMQGQIFDGPEAVEAGLVDGLVESIEELL